ncbi:MAG: glycosyltransferase [Ahniella sp.]|nr:glycosyltransferase [Ahniella sp.]
MSLADAQSRAGLKVTILTLDYRRHGRLLEPSHADLVSLPATFLTRALRGWSLTFAKAATRLAQQHDVVHNHGLWMQPNRQARIAAQTAGVPLVISPRGMLEHYSLNRSSLRKRAAMTAFERRNLDSAALLHATSEEEAASIRVTVPGTRIVVIPNVVAHIEVPRGEDGPLKSLLYLGRLDSKKGIDWLLDAWSLLASKHQDWTLRIVGPVAMGFEDTLDAMKNRHNATPRVTWCAALDGIAKHQEIAASTAVVLPSRSENFGNVVVEAMRHGKPVLATTATPWKVLNDQDLGLQVSTDLEGIRAGLDRLLSMPAGALDAMGMRARDFALSTFSESEIGALWARTYSDLLSRRSGSNIR